jgi:hypothetical protein
MVLVGAWILVTVVLTISYAGNLLSFMTVGKVGPAINSLDELAHSKEIQLTLQAGMEIISNRFLVFLKN